MENESKLNRLAGWIMKLSVFALICAACWFFRSVLVYIIIAFVVSLIGHPIMRLFKRIEIKGRHLPDTLLSIITIFLILFLIGIFVKQLFPVVANIISEASLMNDNGLPYNTMLKNINAWIISVIPSLGSDFDLVSAVLAEIKDVLNVSNVTEAIGTVASKTASISVALFAIVFISFFFIKDDRLFSKIIRALVPDSIEDSVEKTLDEISHLLSRYFIGLLIEVFGVILLNFLGLWLIARINAEYAIGIALIVGILNIIPYVGPLIGEILGILLCMVLKYGAGMGLGVPILAFALIVMAIMLVTQLIDNFVYQPIIYSTSIKSTPLEIFIVLLIAGQIGGTIGLLIGIPAYTVVRVIAARFFCHHKIVKRLMPDIDKENTGTLI